MKGDRDIKLVTTDKRRNQLLLEPNYYTTKLFSENLLATEMKKTKVKIKVKITGKTSNNGNKRHVEIMVPLKYLSNFWRTLEMPLINCEVTLILTWSSITDTKLYVPVVTLSTQGNSKLLQQLKSSFKRVVNWNKYLSKPELLARNPDLNHLVEPSIQTVNRLFVLAFENDTQRT